MPMRTCPRRIKWAVAIYPPLMLSTPRQDNGPSRTVLYIRTVGNRLRPIPQHRPIQPGGRYQQTFHLHGPEGLDQRRLFIVLVVRIARMTWKPCRAATS